MAVFLAKLLDASVTRQTSSTQRNAYVHEALKQVVDVLEVAHVAAAGNDSECADGDETLNILETRERAVGCYTRSMSQAYTLVKHARTKVVGCHDDAVLVAEGEDAGARHDRLSAESALNV